MNYINVYGNAKINLALDVLGKRPDGYHDLSTIMQSLTLKDHIYIRKIFAPTIKIVSNLKWLPTDERNLVYKACKALFDIYKPDRGVYIELTKVIPICAGLGGGSADCAATLHGIRKLFKLPVSDDRLLEIGKSLGADVPFCLKKGTMLAEGIGEKLVRLPDHPFIYVLLAKPNISVSTTKVFSALNMDHIEKRPDTAKIIGAIENNNIDFIAANLCNVLETVTIKQYPIISTIKEIMMKNGAKGALMSGSGPTVFGYFSRREEAYMTLRKLKTDLMLREVYITSTYNGRRNID